MWGVANKRTVLTFLVKLWVTRKNLRDPRRTSDVKYYLLNYLTTLSVAEFISVE
jgi:hypothetical protein